MVNVSPARSKNNSIPLNTPVTTFGIAKAGTSYYAGADDSTTPNYCTWSYFDLPNTTSQITYKVGFRCQNTNTLYTNRTITDTNQATGVERGMCFISATEIAQ